MRRDESEVRLRRAGHVAARGISRRDLIRGASGAGASLLGTNGVRANSVPGAVSTPQATELPAPPIAPASSPRSTAPESPVAVFPIAGTRTASPGTELSFRGLPADAIGTIKVVGNESGAHSGFFLPHADGQGASFLPDSPFAAGEQVTVQTGLNIVGGRSGIYQFTVSNPAPAAVTNTSRDITHPQNVRHFHSRPDLEPPQITITSRKGPTAPGYVFAGARMPDAMNGAMIFDNQGELIWYEPIGLDVASNGDVRVQTYHHKPVVTWWQGLSADGHGLGHYVLHDTSYRQIAALHVGNGYDGGDGHEFLMSPWNTALVTVYNHIKWDLSPVGSSAEGIVFDCIVQELEIPSGRVLFEWHSLDHVGLKESYVSPTKDTVPLFDYFHGNAIAVDLDGNFIVSARHTWALYKIDRVSGAVIWRLGGKQSSFAMGPGTRTAYQHNVDVLPSGDLTIFDNGTGNGSPEPEPQTRGIVVQLDYEHKTAMLVRQYVYPGGLRSASQGNMQTLPNGNVFMGWGNLPNFTEFDAGGSVVFDGRFPSGSYTYRTYRFPWTGHPTEPPALAVEPGSGKMFTVYASWNGATEVATWQVLAGEATDQLQAIATAPRTGFETAISVQTTAPYIAVAAKDKSGQELARSKALETPTK